MKNKYCIKHEETVEIEKLRDGSVGHVCALFAPDWGWCDGPFASVQPPVNFEEDWDLQVIEPTQEEMAIMNCHAEELMQDFEM